jgi:hypothetical protein
MGMERRGAAQFSFLMNYNCTFGLCLYYFWWQTDGPSYRTESPAEYLRVSSPNRLPPGTNRFGASPDAPAWWGTLLSLMLLIMTTSSIAPKVIGIHTYQKQAHLQKGQPRISSSIGAQSSNNNNQHWCQVGNGLACHWMMDPGTTAQPSFEGRS